ncbi:MAG: hypothetical protein ABI615_13195, partial [Chthoniobacterales bacterium]
MQEFLVLVIGFMVVAGIVAIFVFFYLAEEKRKEGLQKAAQAMGLNYDPERNRELVQQMVFLDKLQSGSNQYAQSILAGTCRNEAVILFDFHYETYSTDSKGNRTTHHHWHHLVTLRIPCHFPELSIGPENILTRLGKAFGYPS